METPIPFREFCKKKNPTFNEWWGSYGEVRGLVQLRMAELMADYMDYLSKFITEKSNG